MNDISDATLVAALRRHMTTAAARQAVAAGNLANVDTPGYRTREIDFEASLDAALGERGLTVTNPLHQQPGAAAGPATVEATGLSARRDGNTVQIDRELLAMSRAGADFARAQTALAAKFRLVRYALTESR